MIFLGDCAHPFEDPPPWISAELPWKRQPVVMNFEAALFDGPRVPETGVFSHPSVLRGLPNVVSTLFLANNHLCDSASAARWTLDKVRSAGLRYFGAGEDAAASRAAVIEREGCHDYALIGFGWRVIGVRSRDSGGIALSELSWREVERVFRETQDRHPEAKIVVNMHWNYELELYPQPAHRQLAHDLIAMGACAVIGHHPHIVGGYETVEGRPIVYSLGNWWFPQGVYDHGKVRFPADSYLQVAFELRGGGAHLAHWFQYEPEVHQLAFVGSELAAESDRFAARTPFAGMSHKEYRVWFRRHRLKRKLLPVFVSYDSPRLERALEAYVWLRHQGLLAMERSGIRRVRGM